MSERRLLPEGPLWKTFLIFLGPMMLSNVLQALSGTVNNIYLGQMIGVNALAAVSAFFPILFLFISFIIGLGAGASVLIGQAYGAKEYDSVKAVAGTTLTVAILFGILVAIFGGFFTTPLLAAVGTPPDILPDSTAYARIMLIAMPGLFVFLLTTAMMRGVGDTVTPLYALALSTAIGLVVTPALIEGWFGLPRLGIVSGACASVLSFTLAMIWLAWYLRRRGHPLAPDATLIRALRVDRKILGSVLRIGLPTGVQLILVSLAEVAVLSLVNGFGSEATAAYGTVNQVVSYVQFPAISIAITASIFGAQAIGAGRADRLGAITRTGIVLTLIITGALIALVYLFSRVIIGFFLTSPPVLELAQSLLHITLWSYVLFGLASVISGVMRASGTVLVPMLISIFAIIGVEVPVAYVLSRAIGIDGVWIAYPVAFAAMLIMQGGYYWFFWRKKTITRLI
ncbi:MATE family efflux transporter [Kaistia dalseonensis]|uniref:MATE family efflux protein n=1 Tax=Kaistia dalseonensis TaxID=410840 RepID=A0ABU0H9J7_9HYPH|nr:MATE family efflux transporter [Kaistia dalseonensis]MCX5495935.1 MATE family efflux transporter [Kaistia dalseonensis]MDQ0438538.1 putative MATE family efflux protein [Kaistia dalseonensis]